MDVTPRAPSLPPEQRRAEIIRAARPLLLEHGGRFTTRQVAEAAGIAEGTLFRVFPTKRDLTQAVIAQMIDPSELCSFLDGIDRTLPLDERVRAVIERIQRDIDDISAIFAALFSMPSDDSGHVGQKDGHASPEDRATHERRAAMLHASLRSVLEPDADRLACTLDEAASLVRSMAFATSHPHLSDRRVTDPARITALLLGGLVRRDDTPSAPLPQDPSSTQETPC